MCPLGEERIGIGKDIATRITTQHVGCPAFGACKDAVVEVQEHALRSALGAIGHRFDVDRTAAAACPAERRTQRADELIRVCIIDIKAHDTIGIDWGLDRHGHGLYSRRGQSCAIRRGPEYRRGARIELRWGIIHD